MALTRESRGFVVRLEFPQAGGKPATWSWWYGPDHGWGTTSGPLDCSVAVFPTKAAAVREVRRFYARHRRWEIHPVQDAVALEIAVVKARRDAVVQGDRPDRTRIALACTRTLKALRALQR